MVRRKGSGADERNEQPHRWRLGYHLGPPAPDRQTVRVYIEPYLPHGEIGCQRVLVRAEQERSMNARLAVLVSLVMAVTH